MSENVMNENMPNTTAEAAEAALRYHDLESRYGQHMAYNILLTIEKLAKIQDEIAKAVASHEERLQRAMSRLDAINFSQMQ